MARLAATGEHKARAARQMRATAALMDARHPEMMAGDHLRDAARVLMSGHTEGAKRHLDAAMFMLTPQSLVRHGIRDDDGHADAKHLMHQANRHRLAVQDIEDIHARNDRLRTIARARSQGLEPGDLGDREPVAAANSSLAVLLSARTPMLERTPAPRGRPGGPGLYRVKGMGHTPYLQQVVKALIEKRGMPPGKAYAIARARIRKWLATSKHPEVRAAAARAEAGELARQARAHAHTVQPWEVADALIELACTPSVIELFNPYHGPGGQFTTQQGAQQGKGKQKQQAARKDRKADRPQRRELVHKIASLKLQLASLQAQLRAATSHRTAASGKSRSSTPAKTGAGATSAKAAAAGKASATSAAKTASTAARKSTSAAALRSQIAAVRATLAADIAQLRHL